MKRYLFAATAAILALSSCSVNVYTAQSGQQYKDGLYYRSESPMRADTDTRLAGLIQETSESDIYLIGTASGTDTLAIPAGKTTRFELIEDTTLITVSDGFLSDGGTVNQFYFYNTPLYNWGYYHYPYWADLRIGWGWGNLYGYYGWYGNFWNYWDPWWGWGYDPYYASIWWDPWYNPVFGYGPLYGYYPPYHHHHHHHYPIYGPDHHHGPDRYYGSRNSVGYGTSRGGSSSSISTAIDANRRDAAYASGSRGSVSGSGNDRGTRVTRTTGSTASSAGTATKGEGLSAGRVTRTSGAAPSSSGLNQVGKVTRSKYTTSTTRNPSADASFTGPASTNTRVSGTRTSRTGAAVSVSAPYRRSSSASGFRPASSTSRSTYAPASSTRPASTSSRDAFRRSSSSSSSRQSFTPSRSTSSYRPSGSSASRSSSSASRTTSGGGATRSSGRR